ncbi:MAG: homocysteine S-methyltransferase family protein [Gammaproteobacteria bacterium]|nr:homocysteine S-methyltransferase family protein [Gammaproteobacteria bacterium]
MYDVIARKLANGEVVILDGGTGTELQRQGVAMDSEVWCAMSNLTHADAVRAVHTAYINAGAEVITANTYASSPLSFTHLGREDDIEPIDRAAVRLAREAIQDAASSPVSVAGSCSVMPPVARGGYRSPERQWDPDRIRSLYQRKVDVLADAGCDLIIMEMMRDLDVSLWATEAAVATGLPVWVGMSVERDDEGDLVSFANQKWGLATLAEALMATGAHAALVMHNEISTTGESLALIRSVWNGPLGAYPEAGHFEMPTWVFRDISPGEFAEAAMRWRGGGAYILGGCCGITPEHIGALANAVAGR